MLIHHPLFIIHHSSFTKRVAGVALLLLLLRTQGATQPGGTLAVSVARTEIRCAGEHNGAIRLTLNTGGLPVRYDWIAALNNLTGTGELNLQTPTATIDSLPSGAYRFVFTLADGTAVTEWVALDDPPGIHTSIFAEGDKCLDEDKGLIRVDSIWGGLPPYRISFEGAPLGTQTQWTNLKAGTYFLAVVDDKGCHKQEGVVLPTGLEFTLELGADTLIFSGDTLSVRLATNQLLASAVWTPAQYTYTTSPDSAKLFPFRSETFTVYAVDTNGCAAVDTKTVRVQKVRKVYAPTAFAPAAAQRDNATFWLFADGGIARLELLQVLDRAGRVWFTARDADIDQSELGWNGEFQGKKAPPGVYVWQARLRYSNGEIEWLQGDVALIR